MTLHELITELQGLDISPDTEVKCYVNTDTASGAIQAGNIGIIDSVSYDSTEGPVFIEGIHTERTRSSAWLSKL